MKIKRWFYLPAIFEYKMDLIIFLFLIFIAGLFCGYLWRWGQIEPIVTREVNLLEREMRVIKDERLILIYKIGDLESQLGICRGKNKRQTIPERRVKK